MPCGCRGWSARLARAARPHPGRLGPSSGPPPSCWSEGPGHAAQRRCPAASPLPAPPPTSLVPAHAGLPLTSRPCSRRSPHGITAFSPLGHKILLTLQGPAARGSPSAAERMWQHRRPSAAASGASVSPVSCVPASVTPVSEPRSAEEGGRSSPSSLGAVRGRRGAQQWHPVLQSSQLPLLPLRRRRPSPSSPSQDWRPHSPAWPLHLAPATSAGWGGHTHPPDESTLARST